MIPTLIIFLTGLAAGSFINCLVYRLHTGKPWVKSRSICPHCKHPLAWYDLIPLASFIILKAKCRHCRQKISWQYPLVELVTALSFLLIYSATLQQSTINNQQSTILIINYLSRVASRDQLCFLASNFFIATVLIIIFLYDLKYYLILDKIILPATVIVFIANILFGKSWTNMLSAAVIVTSFFLIQFLVSRGKWLGGGDLRLGFFMGVVLGWPNVIVAIFLAYVLGSVIGLALIIAKTKKWHSKIPFAAFLAPATLIALLWGNQLLNWYLRLF